MGVVGPCIPARAPEFDANINFRSKNSDIERETHTGRKKLRRNMKNLSRKWEKEKRAFAAGGSVLTEGPTMTRKGGLS